MTDFSATRDLKQRPLGPHDSPDADTLTSLHRQVDPEKGAVLVKEIKGAMVDIEQLLARFIESAGRSSTQCPQGLALAVDHAMFPGGARIRPRLSMAVSIACGVSDKQMALGAAGSIELIHAASLVHDDLPCFDDSPVRRGKPSVHSAFGERLGVLAGDALIVLGFQLLAETGIRSPQAVATLVSSLSRGIGMPFGIAAGQAWECENHIEDKAQYQRAKTGALFAAATRGGAIAAGYREPDQWTLLGERLGEAYQIADDILDAVGDPKDIGKPVGRDKDLGRPNMVYELGMDGAVSQLDKLLLRALNAIPDCPRREELRTVMQLECQSLMPRDRKQHAA